MILQTLFCFLLSGPLIYGTFSDTIFSRIFYVICLGLLLSTEFVICWLVKYVMDATESTPEDRDENYQQAEKAITLDLSIPKNDIRK